jgi:F-type H+-transporting ATPase subunit delta
MLGNWPTNKIRQLLKSVKRMTRPLTTGPARRYALALLAEAEASKQVDAVAKDMAALAAALEQSEDFRAAVAHPLVSQKNVSNLLADVCKKLKVAKLTNNFTQLVARNGRINMLEGICWWFAKLLADQRGEVTVTAITPAALTKTQLKAVEKFAKSQLKDATTITVQEQIDATLLGGLKVRLGATEVDCSVRGALQRLKNKLTA